VSDRKATAIEIAERIVSTGGTVQDRRRVVPARAFPIAAAVRNIVVAEDERDAFADAERAAIANDRHGEPRAERVKQGRRVALSSEGIGRCLPGQQEHDAGGDDASHSTP
jgi:hypothetical protein